MAFAGDLTTPGRPPRRLARQPAGRPRRVPRAVGQSRRGRAGQAVPVQPPDPGPPGGGQAQLGLRTLINLRGHRQCGSDALSRAAARRSACAHRHGVRKPRRAAPRPHPALRRHLPAPGDAGADALQVRRRPGRPGRRAGHPVRGRHRREPLAQLSWRFGHWSRSRTGVLDAFFVRYAEQAEGRMPFLTWVRDRVRRSPA